MDRRSFLATGVSGALGVTAAPRHSAAAENPAQDEIRAQFPRVAGETYVNAAAGTPLGTFAEAGLRRYIEFQRLGPGDGRRDYVAEMLAGIRPRFGELIGARPSEIALVHCTKAGEQIVVDGLDPIGTRRNIVTNDMHFTGSLHNLVGLQKAGADVRIVRSRDWDVSLEEMNAAIDDNTALVAVTLVSNITGRIEPMRELADLAHARGALVYADIIQSAGVMPVDMRELGIDFAACNGYKWLYGVHGAGFLYVRDELQGTALPDRLFPGHVQYNYEPWVEHPDPAGEAYVYQQRMDASRYEPGHVSYLGYCAVYEGIKFVQRIGVPAVLERSIRLNKQLVEQLDPSRYETISPDVDRSPIATFEARDYERLEGQLRAANAVVSLLGNGRVRVSSAAYNTEQDIAVLADAMNRA